MAGQLSAIPSMYSPDRLARSTPQPPPRVRPGESARYVSAGLDPRAVAALRAQAAGAGMAVDALVALAVELLAARELLETLGADPEAAVLRPADGDRPAALPPTEPLRDWVGSLEGRSAALAAPAHDDLPQLLLPERLGPRLRHLGIDAVVGAIESGEAVRAKSWDAAAAREGLTLTEWMLAGALAARRTD